MNHRPLRIFICLIIVLSLLAGCTTRFDQGEDMVDAGEKGGRLKVYASFYPYYDFAKNIGGNLVDVDTVVPSGVEPHSFEPSPKDIVELEKAHIFIYNGLDMEPWVEGVLNILKEKNTYIVEASKGLDLITYNGSTPEDHSHDHDHEHRGQYDPHIWVDPVNVIHIAGQIKDALISVDPSNEKIYEENYLAYKSELEKLDHAFKEGLKDVSSRKVIVSHSAFGYLTRRYGIEEISVAGISPHGEPSPKRLAELTNMARSNNIHYIFFEALASVKTAEVLAKEANLEVLTLYNVEGLTEEQIKKGEDYISLMYKNIESLQKALVR